MRTTLEIDDDVLTVARAMARQQHRSVGKLVSELARSALTKPQRRTARNGIQLLPLTNAKAVVTMEIVNELRDELL